MVGVSKTDCLKNIEKIRYERKVRKSAYLRSWKQHQMKKVNIEMEKAAGVCKQMSRSIQKDVKKRMTSIWLKRSGG